MNREIKFRGIAESSGRWVIGNTIIFDNDIHQVFICDTHAGWRKFDWQEVVNKTVGQFTGLHDKHGREIYEGDIVTMMRTPEKRKKAVLTSHVVTCHSTLDWVLESLAKEVVGLCMGNLSDRYYSDRLEIIGNIHDNPELAQSYSLNLPNPKQRKQKPNGEIQVEFVVKEEPNDKEYIVFDSEKGVRIVQEVTQEQMNELVKESLKLKNEQ